MWVTSGTPWAEVMEAMLAYDGPNGVGVSYMVDIPPWTGCYKPLAW